MPYTLVKVFAPVPTTVLIERLAAVGITALDLPPAHPLTVRFNEGNANIQSFLFEPKQIYDRENVEAVNFHLRAIKIEALDLATPLKDDNYRRPIQGRGPMCSVTMPNGRVKIMDFAGKILMDVNPNKFEPLPYFPKSFHQLPKASESFGLFQHLPCAIQNKVWTMASANWDGRIFVACETTTGSWKVAGAVPSLLRVANSVHRDIGLGSNLKPMFRSTNNAETILFDPAKDVLWLTDSVEFVSNTSPRCYSAMTADFSLVEHLIVDLELLEANPIYGLGDTYSINLLSTMEICGHGRASREFVLSFELGDANNGRGLVPFYRYPTGIDVKGGRAMARILDFVELRSEKARLQKLWKMFGKARLATVSMPPVIDVIVHYK